MIQHFYVLKSNHLTIKKYFLNVSESVHLTFVKHASLWFVNNLRRNQFIYNQYNIQIILKKFIFYI